MCVQLYLCVIFTKSEKLKTVIIIIKTPSLSEIFSHWLSSLKEAGTFPWRSLYLYTQLASIIFENGL